MATFNERGESTSGKYVDEQGIKMSNWSKTLQIFCPHFSIFALEKQPKNLNFQSVLTSSKHFRGYFRWNGWTYFQKISSWNSYNDAKSIKTILKILVALLRCCRFWSVFALDKQHKYLTFQIVFTSNRPFEGYFQWKRFTNLKKICCYNTYNAAKENKNLGNFLVALVHFSFR